MRDEYGELSEPRPYTPAFVPEPPLKPGYTMYDLYGYWFAGWTGENETYGVYVELWEYAQGQWRYLLTTYGDTIGPAWKAAKARATRLLVEGQRVEATMASDELSGLVSHYQETGQHLLKRDADNAHE